MKYRIAGVLAVVVVFAFADRAYAPLFELSYTEFAKGVWRAFEEVSTARGLAPPDAYFAQMTAAAWFHVGPCRGDGRALGEGPPQVIGYVLNARPDRPVEAAVLEMIAIMSRDGLGREPSPHMCKFALETAVPERPIE
jgi:hypothetical protein